MQAFKKYRDWVNRLRKRHGKKNGTIPSFCFDDYIAERQYETSKKNYKRYQSKLIGEQE